MTPFPISFQWKQATKPPMTKITFGTMQPGTTRIERPSPGKHELRGASFHKHVHKCVFRKQPETRTHAREKGATSLAFYLAMSLIRCRQAAWKVQLNDYLQNGFSVYMQKYMNENADLNPIWASDDEAHAHDLDQLRNATPWYDAPIVLPTTAAWRLQLNAHLDSLWYVHKYVNKSHIISFPYENPFNSWVSVKRAPAVACSIVEDEA